jgi:hypothetical protein
MIHQSLLNSLLFPAHEVYMPFKIASAGLSTQVKSLLHEIANKFGQDCDISLEASISSVDDSAIKIKKAQGFVIGDNKNVVLDLAFYASNATTNSTLAVEF